MMEKVLETTENVYSKLRIDSLKVVNLGEGNEGSVATKFIS